jgi:hypothetical protein
MTGETWTTIRVRGHLGPAWSTWFDDMTITQEDDGTTTLAGTVVDQAALHSLLVRIRDLGLELVRVEVGESPHPRPPCP